jgi:hypothetical protein
MAVVDFTALVAFAQGMRCAVSYVEDEEFNCQGRQGWRTISSHTHGRSSSAACALAQQGTMVEWRDLSLCTAAGCRLRLTAAATMRGSINHSSLRIRSPLPLPFASLSHPPRILTFCQHLGLPWRLVSCSAQPSYHQSVILSCPRDTQIL